MQDCIFCKILKGEAPGGIEYVSTHWATLTPLEQISKGHILLIPILHCENIMDMQNPEVLEELGETLKKVCKNQLIKYKADGINILNANGEAAQQSVSHLHFHIIPRYKGDKLDLWLREKL